MGNIGPLEIGIVLVIALVIFGPKRLPELGRSLGDGIKEFRDSMTNHDEKPRELGSNANAAETTTAAPADVPVVVPAATPTAEPDNREPTAGS